MSTVTVGRPVPRAVRARLWPFVALPALFFLGRWSVPESDRVPGAPEESRPGWGADALDQRLAAAQHRTLAERRIAQALAAGRLPLREAAARLADLNLTNPGFDVRKFREHFPGANDTERCYRQAMARALAELECEPDPDETEFVQQRLETELESDRRQGILRRPL